MQIHFRTYDLIWIPMMNVDHLKSQANVINNSTMSFVNLTHKNKIIAGIKTASGIEFTIKTLCRLPLSRLNYRTYSFVRKTDANQFSTINGYLY